MARTVDRERYVITACLGCAAWPMRDDGSATMHEFNYLTPCARCGMRVCLVCTDKGHGECNP